MTRNTPNLQPIALIGANSRIGPALIAEVEGSTLFTLTILQRPASRPPHTTSPSTKLVTLPSDLTAPSARSELVSALKGHTALISALPGSSVDLHKAIADACITASIPRFIPADYGSVDSADPVVAALVPLYKQKTAVREYLTELTRQHPHFSWTSLVCGHFFDYGLDTELLMFNVRAATAEIFDGGNVKWSASTLKQIGRGVVGIFGALEETKNKKLYMQSFLTTQNEVLAALEKVSGKKFEVTQLRSGEYIKEKKKRLDQGGEDQAEVTEQLVAVLGITRANWTSEKEFANELLGLKDEDVEEEVRRTYEKLIKA